MHGLHPFINKTEDMDIWMCLFVYCFCFELDISLPYLNSMNSEYKIPVFLKYAVWVPHLRGFEKRLFSVVLVFALFQFSFILWGILVLVLTLLIFIFFVRRTPSVSCTVLLWNYLIWLINVEKWSLVAFDFSHLHKQQAFFLLYFM